MGYNGEYNNISGCRVDPESPRDNRHILASTASRFTTHHQPWRSSRYFPSTTEASGYINQARPKQQQRSGCPQNQCVPNDCSLDLVGAPCYPGPVSTKTHFPFRKVIIASKYILLPEKEIHTNTFQSSMCNQLSNSTVLPQSTPQEIPNVTQKANDLSGYSHDPKRPVTPPFGRSARLNEFIRQRLQSGGVTGFQSPHNCLQFPQPENKQDRTMYHALEREINNLQENTNKYNTQMCPFKDDQRILNKAFRAYKRDQELQQDRGQYLDIKMFPDVCDRSWYDYMMSGPNPAPQNSQIESTFNPVRAQHVSLGSAHRDHTMGDGGYGRREVRHSDPFSDLHIKESKPPVEAVSRQSPEDRYSLECAVDENLHAIRAEINERDRLIETLYFADQSIQSARGKFCEVQGDSKEISDLIRQIRTAESYKRNTLSEIRYKESSLSEMMRHQHYLESKRMGLQFT